MRWAQTEVTGTVCVRGRQRDRETEIKSKKCAWIKMSSGAEGKER